MKRVLIITYYWPPSGGSGVQRWLKMSKYLPEFDWQPVIYTTENAEYPMIDPSLEKDVPADMEVIRRPIVEPYIWMPVGIAGSWLSIMIWCLAAHSMTLR